MRVKARKTPVETAGHPWLPAGGAPSLPAADPDWSCYPCGNRTPVVRDDGSLYCGTCHPLVVRKP